MIKQWIALALLIGLAACGATPEPAAAPPPPAQAYIGDKVTVGSTEWIVKSVATPGSSYTGNGRTATTGGAYVVIELQVANLSDTPRTLSEGMAKLFTNDHAPYTPDTEPTILLANPDQCLNLNVPGKQVVSCFAIYKTLPDTFPAQLEVSDLGSPSSAIMIDLTKKGT